MAHASRLATARPPGDGPKPRRGGDHRLRLLALVQRGPDQAPNQRFRHEQWAPYLERDHGILLHFAAYESPELTVLLDHPGRRARKLYLATRDLCRRWLRRHEAEAFDGVVILREAALVGGAIIERVIARRGIPIIYDFDDAVWLPRPEGARWSTMLARMPSKVPGICRIARAVTVGNEYLRAFAVRYNDRVHIVPTSIDLERFREFRPKPNASPFTIVWTGSSSTLKYLELLRPALQELGSRMPVRLRVICDRQPSPFPGVTVDFIPWSVDSEVRALEDSHVGVMPLPDTPWTRGKCACKALQYMATGRPAVVSPVGVNRQLIRHGENGLIATDHASWVTQLERLARDAALQRRLAAAGRRTIESGYSATVSARAFAAVVHRTIGAGTAELRGRAVAAG